MNEQQVGEQGQRAIAKIANIHRVLDQALDPFGPAQQEAQQIVALLVQSTIEIDPSKVDAGKQETLTAAKKTLYTLSEAIQKHQIDPLEPLSYQAMGQLLDRAKQAWQEVVRIQRHQEMYTSKTTVLERCIELLKDQQKKLDPSIHRQLLQVKKSLVGITDDIERNIDRVLSDEANAAINRAAEKLQAAMSKLHQCSEDSEYLGIHRFSLQGDIEKAQENIAKIIEAHKEVKMSLSAPEEDNEPPLETFDAVDREQDSVEHVQQPKRKSVQQPQHARTEREKENQAPSVTHESEHSTLPQKKQSEGRSKQTQSRQSFFTKKSSLDALREPKQPQVESVKQTSLDESFNELTTFPTNHKFTEINLVQDKCFKILGRMYKKSTQQSVKETVVAYAVKIRSAEDTKQLKEQVSGIKKELGKISQLTRKEKMSINAELNKVLREIPKESKKMPFNLGKRK